MTLSEQTISAIARALLNDRRALSTGRAFWGDPGLRAHIARQHLESISRDLLENARALSELANSCAPWLKQRPEWQSIINELTPQTDLLELKPSTKSQYRRQKDNFWKVHLSNKPIQEFVHSDIKAALKKGTWKSNKSRNNQLSIIRSVFDLAIMDKQIKENPCSGLEYADVQLRGPDPFSLAEVRKILASVAENYNEQVLNYLQFQFFSGLRTSEAIALSWSNVDVNKGEILVEEVNVYDEEQDSTKTSTSRVVKLPREALAAVLSQKRFTGSSGKVFHDPYYNEPWLYHRITRAAFWTTTLKRLGIRHRRTYNTRHTYATIGLMAGVNPAFMARQLGHSLEMFFRVYAKWIDGQHDERELAKIESALRTSE